jgi:hypothetical protein
MECEMTSKIIPALVAGALLVPGYAHASDISLPLNDTSQQAIGKLPGVLDQCVAGITVRGDPAACRLLGNLLNGLASDVQQAAAKADADAKAGAAAAKEK